MVGYSQQICTQKVVLHCEPTSRFEQCWEEEAWSDTAVSAFERQVRDAWLTTAHGLHRMQLQTLHHS